MSVQSGLAARLDADLDRLRIDVAPETRARWVEAVARVEAELGAGGSTWPAPSQQAGTVPADRGGEGSIPGVTSSPGALTPRREVPDDGPWVWRPGEPLPALGSGALNGVRLAVKDLMALAGQPLRAGSRVREDTPPEPVEAAVVTTLRRAGAMVVGSVKLHEFAFGVSGINAFEGTPTNPAAPGRVPGGSSSGSAVVVAAGQADVALGTDTGGSCRIPAACCAVVGFKPGYGRIDLDGVFPLAPSLDHVGWLARDVATVAAVALATGLIAPAGGGSGGSGVSGRKALLGVARGAIEGASPEVKSAWSEVEALVRAAGWELVDVDWPTGEDSFAASTAIMFAEAAHVHRETIDQHADRYGEDVRARLLQGRLFDLSTYLRARERQAVLRARCRAALVGAVGAVIGPTLSTMPPILAEGADPSAGAALVKHTRLANLTGFPALSIPASAPPLSGTAIPFGIQVEAATEEEVLRVGAALEPVLRQRR